MVGSGNFEPCSAFSSVLPLAPVAPPEADCAVAVLVSVMVWPLWRAVEMKASLRDGVVRRVDCGTRCLAMS